MLYYIFAESIKTEGVNSIMRFAVIGGDMRQVKLSEFLAEDGRDVTAFALDKVNMDARIKKTDTAAEAVTAAECIILPLPALSKDGILNAPLSKRVHTISEVLSVAKPNQIICAGKIDEIIKITAAERGLKIFDYLEREEFAIANAVATAEGAIQIMMEETSITLSKAKCLIIGYGRIGKTLASRLKGIDADVTVSARKCSDIAWIEAYGYKAANTNFLDGTLAEYDIVINTVPAYVMNYLRLSELKKDCLCLDLASKPGGIDFSEASKLGIKTIWALSLPGEVAPVSSGKAIKETVYNIMREQGWKDE